MSTQQSWWTLLFVAIYNLVSWHCAATLWGEWHFLHFNMNKMRCRKINNFPKSVWRKGLHVSTSVVLSPKGNKMQFKHFTLNPPEKLTWTSQCQIPVSLARSCELQKEIYFLRRASCTQPGHWLGWQGLIWADFMDKGYGAGHVLSQQGHWQ